MKKQWQIEDGNKNDRFEGTDRESRRNEIADMFAKAAAKLNVREGES
jgi:hypothetical protein